MHKVMTEQVTRDDVPQWSPPVNGGSTAAVQSASVPLPQWSPPVNGGSSALGTAAAAGRNGAHR